MQADLPRGHGDRVRVSIIIIIIFFFFFVFFFFATWLMHGLNDEKQMMLGMFVVSNLAARRIV